MGKYLQASPWVPGARCSSGDYTGGPAKALLHATIAPSMALPGYANQGMAPHETLRWDAVKKKLIANQHYWFNNFAKALANAPGGVETNRDSVLQWELAGYLGANGATVPRGEFDILTAPDTYWEQVADHIGPTIVSWDIQQTIYPTAAGRMSYSQWDNFSGLCTHADVPENNHWDLPIPDGAVQILAKKIWTTGAVVIRPPASTVPSAFKVAPRYPLPVGHVFGWRTGPATMHSGYYSATDRANIRIWQNKMKDRGWKIDVDGFYGQETHDVAKAFQEEKHLNPKGKPGDGLIGSSTWKSAWESPVT